MTKETYRQGCETICDKLNVPPEVMSWKDVKYENKSAAEKFLYQNNVIPSNNKDMRVYTNFFKLNELDTPVRLKCDFDELPVMQEDQVQAATAMKTKTEAVQLQYTNGYITKNMAYVKTGWALSYFNYNLPLLGYGAIASRFIEPQYRIFKKLQFGVRASAGIAYLSNPNDADKNPENNNYALHINPYLHLGTSLNLQVSKHISAGLQSNFHHISNGNLQQPNKGINWITAALSLNYYPGNNTLPKYKRVHQNFWKKNKAVIQAGIFYTPRQGYFAKWMAQRKYAAGVFTQITKQIGGLSALTAGTEIYYNNFKQDANTAPLKSGIVAGIHGGHVFLLGKVHFSQQAGFNIYNKIYFLPNFYHRWGLDYSINKKYTIGASLKANSDNADFFDFRMSLRL